MTSSNGATIPMASYVGRMPMVKVAAEVTMITRPSVVRRPMRSPIEPKNRPPRGRMMNPAAKTPNDDRSAACGSPASKKCTAMTVASVP